MRDVRIPVSTPLATSMTSHFFFLKKKKKQKKIKLRKDMDENLRDHEMDFVFINCAQVSS